jgi:methionyl-tRNA formyltransferase
MIPEKIINEMGEYFFVIHPSLLPLYRGAAPIQHALLNGESTSGVSVITVSQDRFDAG